MSLSLKSSTLRLAFKQRSGRVIALSRALLAAFFTFAVVLDPGETGDQAGTIVLLLSAYTIFACIIFSLTWNSWWLEARLALPAHGVDMIVFTALIILTQGYISPFFIFYVFLTLSSTIRGGWREALVTTALVIMLFVAAAVLSTFGSTGSEGLEVQRFVVRGAHLVVVSFMIIWFGISQLGSSQGRLAIRHEDGLNEIGPPIRQALEHAADRLNAAHVVLAWSEVDEPWLYVASIMHGSLKQEKFGPEEFPPLVDATVSERSFLFDIGERRLLFREGGLRQTVSYNDPITPMFVDRFGIDAGLAIPIQSDSYEGHLFAMSAPGLSSDDLRIADQIGVEISTAFERSMVFAATQETVATRTRLLLARDLHDSSIQFLAGLGLRLEGLKKAVGETPSAVQEINDLQNQLIHEQRELRGLISSLSDPKSAEHTAGLAGKLLELGSRLERQWGIDCELSLDASLSLVPIELHHDIVQLLREAVANAVRHGKAGRIVIDATVEDEQLKLNIGDNGKGFPIDGAFEDSDLKDGRIGPRSLYERVHLLWGSMQLSSNSRIGATLMLRLPLQEKRT